MDYEEIELELFPSEEEQTELDIFGDALATHTGVWARKVTETGLGEYDIVLIFVGVEVFDSDLVIDERTTIFLLLKEVLEKLISSFLGKTIPILLIGTALGLLNRWAQLCRS